MNHEQSKRPTELLISLRNGAQLVFPPDGVLAVTLQDGQRFEVVSKYASTVTLEGGQDATHGGKGGEIRLIFPHGVNSIDLTAERLGL